MRIVGQLLMALSVLILSAQPTHHAAADLELRALDCCGAEGCCCHVSPAPTNPGTLPAAIPVSPAIDLAMVPPVAEVMLPAPPLVACCLPSVAPAESPPLYALTHSYLI